MKENSREEDIALIEKSLCDKDTIIQYHYWVGTDFLNAVERIVADYKIVLKENEVLLKENKELQKEIDQMKSLDIYKLVEDWETGQFIPVQKVKDKIEELKKKVEELTDEQGYWGGSDLLEQIKVLEEILEKEQ